MMTIFKKPIVLSIILILLGLLTRLLFLSSPSQIVFDEVHFGSFASSYFTHQHYFDIHPPLGKLIIALGAYIGGYQSYVAAHGAFPFHLIGDAYGSVPFIWFRFFPALAGALIPAAFFYVLRQFRIRPLIAFLGGLSLVFENMLLVQSRFILIDAFLLLFGLFGLGVFLRARNKNYNMRLVIISGLFLGACASIKWTALGYLFIVGFFILSDLVVYSKKHLPIKKILYCILRMMVGFVLIPFLVYFMSFVIHFRLLSLPGSGDAFMSKQFQQKTIFGKFIELNNKMYVYNKSITKPHPDASTAFTWPTMNSPVYYWVNSDTTRAEKEKIYLMGNPVLWLCGIAGMLWLLFYGLKKYPHQDVTLVLIIGYVANYIPFFFIHRPLFLYHYFSAFLFSLLAFWVGADHVLPKVSPQLRMVLLATLFLLTIGSFVLISPLSYGFIW
ncbi:MAG TPA: phospholipid carrier-dependent glycosyltransferase [Patescibacteria group bacterium]|nr:phospholipid carrier-dependent glycosyltransferase [Patescibacteria group bacterium]